MKRPWQIWTVFAVSLAVLLGVMGWITGNVLKLEAANAAAQQQAVVEETVRLALWRMDAAISPLVFEENARPYFEYMAFNPTRTVYPNSVNDNVGDDLIPSPLLNRSSSNIMVYFNGIVPTGKMSSSLSSPQIPTGEMRQWAIDNYKIGIIMTGNDANLRTLSSSISVNELQKAIGKNKAMDISSMPAVDIENQPPTIVMNAPAQPMQQQVNWAQQADVQNQQQARKNTWEYNSRWGQRQKAESKVKQSKKDLYEYRNLKKGGFVSKGGKKLKTPALPEARDMYKTTIDESVMRPLWIREFLVLARKVKTGDKTYIQGAWLNWPNIKKELLGEIRDILPSADLNPVKDVRAVKRSRMMAALPVELVPGAPAGVAAIVGSPLRVPLTVAWCGILIAAAAVGLLLVGAVSLSERRGAFVSAVTHELRTPLTTFRMYSEMLAEGMVKDAEKRKQYFGTLVSESNRLSHLVENVLAYARLERGRASGHVEALVVREIFDRVEDRLIQRAEQAGMRLVVNRNETAIDTQVKTDMTAAEQILFNLVDNACKYAVGAQDKRIHVEPVLLGEKVIIRVRDHGPGIAREEARRLFKPFRKSAQHAAESAPGVGLGLALSRDLARQVGATLRICPGLTEGACFELVFVATQ